MVQRRAVGLGMKARIGCHTFRATGITAYFSVRYLVRYFETRTLTPFAIYSLDVGAASLLRFAAF